MLGPQEPEHRQLDVVRLRLEQLDDALVLEVGEAELAVLGGRDGHPRLSGSGVKERSIAALHVVSHRTESGESFRVAVCSDREMRPRTTIPRAALALGVLASLALAPGALGAPGPPPALLATSGDHGELLQAVPIAKRPQVHERVAMSLGPDRLQVIQAGDRLRASAEVQVSTTCLDPGPRCIGRNYDINPRSPPGSSSPAPGARPRRRSRSRRDDEALQAAASEPQPPLHADDPQRRDPGRRPGDPAVRAGRLLRQPDRRRLQQARQARRPCRPRRRPSRRLGRPGQGQAQPRPSARRRSGSDGQFECDAGQRRRCR